MKHDLLTKLIVSFKNNICVVDNNTTIIDNKVGRH